MPSHSSSRSTLELISGLRQFQLIRYDFAGPLIYTKKRKSLQPFASDSLTRAVYTDLMRDQSLGDQPLSTYAKFSEKLTFLTS